MSNTINDGGSAFPHGEIVQDMRDEKGLFIGCRVWEQSPGMTIRDWLASQALAGLMAEPVDVACSYTEYAVAAYQIADAMIAARKGGAE